MWLSFDQFFLVIISLTSWTLGNNKIQTWGDAHKLNACMCGNKVCTPILKVIEPYNYNFETIVKRDCE
jgi:hypothetical protein